MAKMVIGEKTLHDFGNFLDYVLLNGSGNSKELNRKGDD
jgi:hypothetical protein